MVALDIVLMIISVSYCFQLLLLAIAVLAEVRPPGRSGRFGRGRMWSQTSVSPMIETPAVLSETPNWLVAIPGPDYAGATGRKL